MPESRITTINARKFDGSIHRSWQAELISDEAPLLIFRGVFEDAVTHKDLGFIKPGTISYEYYWLDRWFNVFRFHEPDGAFRNFYCNINMPPTFKNGTLDYIDLDIDMIVNKDLEITLLDEAEFRSNKEFYGYSDELSERVFRTSKELTNLIEAARFPFDSIEL